MTTAKTNIGSVTMPAGTYFVGDPCYAVPDDEWMTWLEAAWEGGDPNTMRYLLADVEGRAVLGIGTMHGDGTFRGSDGFDYPVDAGLLGVVPVEVAEFGSDTERGMTRVDFEKDFECSYDKDTGEITLGDITIDTDPEPEYGEGEW